MSTDKVEIYTQPPDQDQKSESVEESIATKLEELIVKHPVLPEDADEGEGNDEKAEDDRGSKLQQKQEKAKEDIKKAHSTKHVEGRHKEAQDSESESETEDEADVELDHDGMEVPQGKIPLDGQFSTEELKKLIEVAQEKGILSEDVDLKVVDSSEIGDRIRLADSQASDNKEEEGKEKEEEGKEKEEEGKEKEG
ncbi:hypothetical protein KGF57_003738 [Candida theae]|uniref:Uncharacterized protein n=1 Tax=Candida theae TaxID=1198502 RepID=A0AAD5BCQ3_9ASCO|nr:uncharacterized protein KGF57_003738 [Candida theae]KAI5954715.1 hypothetical protein KGF57_003738 [Candida theae]